MVRIRAASSHAFLAVLIAALAVGLVASSAFAARGGGQGKPSGSGSTSTSATLAAVCPCYATSPIQFTGSGYDASRAYAMLSFSGATTQTVVWADGTISHSWPYFSQPGTYWVRAYQPGNGGKMVLKAETFVTVQ